ncbi:MULTISPECIES: oligopeptide/dipeptide ABC transporter ATP-binding protein [Corallincola]|uniref:ATP-binding cassette domain-containing protein n=3 Tax=Corallincola TaxID=1775176 RepID=A0A368MZL2_9GAMM|nr:MULTISPECIES: oligopeptide/dipeptide ABC transporter ATP-binding protein [Corallincola]RCU43658.1 ATP-binding cassette domain-containing protein [Corallincola holothuriorum]TAA42735.1 ATP-binding cassette domain-containing protein [Corallincola spongiicola]TCI01614.1 ATP-binding cassette domain-containing protein [Corallincola luteus]
MSLLDIKNLTIALNTQDGLVTAVDKVSLSLADGEIHALAGESGSGKSLLAKAIIGLLSDDWTVIADRMFYEGEDLQAMDFQQRRELMGNEIAMIFQDPANSLDPIVRIEEQLLEALPRTITKGPLNFFRARKKLRQQAITLLHQVGVKDHERLLKAYPHEISEGLCQKVVIAMAIALRPRLLIADEPTATMEPRAQGQLFRLLRKFNQLHNMSILLLSHDMYTAAQLSTRITMMYSGHVVESGLTERMIQFPVHPYTEAMVASTPSFSGQVTKKAPLPELRGGVPTLQHMPIGCRLGPRCPYAQRQCVELPLLKRFKGRSYRCHYPLNLDALRKKDKS